MLEQKLLAYTENHAVGGGNKYMIDVLNGLHLLGCGPIELISNEGGIQPQEFERIEFPCPQDELTLTSPFAGLSLPVPVRRFMTLLKLPVFIVANSVRLMRVLKARSPDSLLLFNGGFPGAWSVLLFSVVAAWQGVNSYLFVVSTPSLGRGRIIKMFWRLIAAAVDRSVFRIVVNAQVVKREMVDDLGFTEAKIVVVPNGLRPLPLSGHLRQEPNTLVVGSIFRLDYSKGALYLLDAYIELLKRFDDVRFVIAGTGPALGEMRRKVEELDLADRIDMVGFYEGDVADVLKGIDVYVFPSLHEGLPYSVMEAMRSRIAIVATKVGGIPEMIDNGVNGILVEPASVEQLVSAISFFLENQKEREKMADSAYESFLANYSLDRFASRLKKMVCQ